MSTVIKAAMLFTALAAISACSQPEPAPAPEPAPMLEPEPTYSKV